MIPQSKETEELLIGYLLSNENSFDSVFDVLDPKDFHDDVCERIFNSMVRLYSKNKRFDFVTIAQDIDPKAFEYWIKTYLIPLSLKGPEHLGSWNVSEYAQKIRELSERRRLLKAGEEIVRISREGIYGSSRELFDDAERSLTNAEPKKLSKTGLVSIKDLAMPYFEFVEKVTLNPSQIIGVPTGWTDLDALTLGWQEQNLVIVGARPSVGKTAWLLNAGLNASLQENTYFALFELEMDKNIDLMSRIVSSMSDIDMHELRSGLQDNSWPKFTNVIGYIPERFLVDDTSGMTSTYIKREVRRLRRKIGNEAKLIIGIDYLTRISKPTNMTRYDFVTDTVIELKELARECNCTVISLVQLSRGVEQRQNKRPMLSDIRESGQVEQEADIVAFLHRDDYYNKDSQNSVMEVIISKNRNAPTGTVELAFIKQYQKFKSLAVYS